MSNKFSEGVMQILRRQLDLNPRDKSCDDKINAYSNREAFNEVVTWQMGSAEFAGEFIEWLQGCGYEVKEIQS